MATLFWDAHSAGTMDLATLQQRRCVVVQFTLALGGTTIYWTDDGTTSGTSLFKNSDSPVLHPWVEIALSPQGGATFSAAQSGGPITPTEASPTAASQWMWRTKYDSSGTGFWQTEIYRGGPEEASDYGFSLAGGTDELTGVAYAMGRGA